MCSIVRCAFVLCAFILLKIIDPKKLGNINLKIMTKSLRKTKYFFLQKFKPKKFAQNKNIFFCKNSNAKKNCNFYSKLYISILTCNHFILTRIPPNNFDRQIEVAGGHADRLRSCRSRSCRQTNKTDRQV